MTLAADRYLSSLRADAALLATAARRDRAAAVPSCPGWSVTDVVEHVAVVYEHKVACMRLGHAPDPWPPGIPPGDPVDRLETALAELIDELVARGPAAPAYTWHEPDQTVGFWYRRMAQETAVHRVDVQLALGAPGPIDADIASDGIDELLDVMLAGDWSDLPQPERRTVVALDPGDGTRVVVLEPDQVRIDRSGAAGPSDAALGGRPDDLLLWGWHRRDLAGLASTGDPAAIAALHNRLQLVTQ
jgi:uncharacterized protein (TIGR03083 family)